MAFPSIEAHLFSYFLLSPILLLVGITVHLSNLQKVANRSIGEVNSTQQIGHSMCPSKHVPGRSSWLVLVEGKLFLWVKFTVSAMGLNGLNSQHSFFTRKLGL